MKKFDTDKDLPHHFEPEELQKILKKATEHDISKCTITRESKKKGSSKVNLPLKSVPLLPHLMLFMLTGTRSNEGLNLTWQNVNLKTGAISIRKETTKTKRSRMLPMKNAFKGISPTFLEILRVWRQLCNDDKFVLPHPLSEKPSDIRKPLVNFRDSIGVYELCFQNLRKNFESYAVSSGIPPAVTAMWVGHSTVVAEEFYAEYVFGQLKGNTLDEVMGISKILKEILDGYNGKGKYKNLAMTKWRKSEEE